MKKTTTFEELAFQTFTLKFRSPSLEIGKLKIDRTFYENLKTVLQGDLREIEGGRHEIETVTL